MLNRRSFVTSTLGAGAVLATQGPRKAHAQVDRRIIVDAQVHLWKAESPDWKWVPGARPQLPEPMTFERLVPMMDEAGVDRAVIVPPSWPGDRNDYALEAVKRYPNRFRIMGRIPLQDPKSADLLPRWKEQQGMVGMRVTFNNAQNTPWLTDGTANWFWAAAEKAGLPVMCFAPGNTALLGPIAERHPQLALILDHMNVTAAMVKDNKIDVEAIVVQAVALAKYPNVSVAASASPGLSREPYPFRDVAGLPQARVRRLRPRSAATSGHGHHQLLPPRRATASASAHFHRRVELSQLMRPYWVMGRAVMLRLR